MEFALNDMGFIAATPPRDLSEIDVKTFEGRAAFEVDLYVSTQLVTNLVEIDQVNITGEVENTGLGEFSLNVSK